MQFILLVVVLCAFNFGKCEEDEDFRYPDDWVDPGNMFTFDINTKTNIKEVMLVPLTWCLVIKTYCVVCLSLVKGINRANC